MYEPDIIILYCGNNDASVSGYYTDREILDRQILKEHRRFLSSFAFFRVLNFTPEISMDRCCTILISCPVRPSYADRVSMRISDL